MASPHRAHLVRFGVFEVNLLTGELRKQGARIKLQEQPFQVLAMLLERPGEMVPREELQARLWPKDTFVDFDHSLNKAINKIRDALCDSADNPRYIETLARRGYRFIAPVEALNRIPATLNYAKPLPVVVIAEPGTQPFGRLLIGEQLGPHAILSLLGRGGMGEVYRARDTRLERVAALKILPPEMAADPDRLRRFIREAKAASALNHPNIATIYEIGESDGIYWIAMELVEGQTLSRLIAAGADSNVPREGTGGSIPLPMDLILEVGIQVADALEEAHSQGIVHRDIQPANLMLTPKRQIKVLDFGLAKVVRREGVLASEQTGETPALPSLVLGTALYMSPEQVLGQAVDHRSDIFSLGVTLYEMAVGRTPFSGETSLSLFDAIVHQPVRWPLLAEGRIPEGLRQIIGKALEKSQETRYQTTADMAAALRILKREMETDLASLKTARHISAGSFSLRSLKKKWVLATVAVASLLLLTAAGVYWSSRYQRLGDPVQIQKRITSNPRENPVAYAAISPDGKFLAYSDRAGMHVKLVESGEMLTMAQPEGPSPRVETWQPRSWFPDSSRFLATRWDDQGQPSLWVVSVLGGTPRKLRDDGSAGAISPDGSTIVFLAGARSDD